MALNPKQERFAQEYIIDLNAKQAAIRAGYSPKTAEQQGSRLLSNAKVREYIQKAQRKVGERIEITQDMVISGLYDEATREGEGASHGARVSAWEKLGKHLGMFTDKTEITGANGGPVQNKWTVEFINASSEGKPKA